MKGSNAGSVYRIKSILHPLISTAEPFAAIGGSGSDTFLFPGPSLSALGSFASIDGGSGVNTLDFTGMTDAIALNLAAGRVTGVANLAGANVQSIVGGSNGDTFTVTPSATTAFAIAGGNPAPPTLPGDSLIIVLSDGAAGTTLGANLGASGYSGNYTFTNRSAVDFSQIETLLPANQVAASDRDAGEFPPVQTIVPANQAAFAATATPTTIAFGEASALGTTGGSGTGAVTYAVTTGASICSITAGTTLTGIDVGTCTLSATKAADANYLAASATVDVIVSKASQSPLAATATPTTNADGDIFALGTIGGSGTSAVTYAVTAGAGSCSIAGSMLYGTGAAGTCTVTATKGEDAHYLAAMATVDVTVVAATPVPTLSNWGSITLSGLLALLGLACVRRRTDSMPP